MESGELIMPGPGKQGVDGVSTEHSQRNVAFCLRFQEGKFGVNLGGWCVLSDEVVEKGYVFNRKIRRMFPTW